jgi:DNA-binding MarR family transcriptional regulator
MSRSRTLRPIHSRSARPDRSAAADHGCAPLQSKQEPTAAELAEALLWTAHAFKQWGNLCFSQAEPGLRELSIPRARLLAVVSDAGETPVRMGELSSALGVTARNVTTIVDALEDEGLLARKDDPTDRRAILLELTEMGRAHVEHVHALQRELAERLFSPLTPGECHTFHSLLARVARHLGEVSGAWGEA